jgi:hypothetical protein
MGENREVLGKGMGQQNRRREETSQISKSGRHSKQLSVSVFPTPKYQLADVFHFIGADDVYLTIQISASVFLF